jgi:hypothetical protein
VGEVTIEGSTYIDVESGTDDPRMLFSCSADPGHEEVTTGTVYLDGEPAGGPETARFPVTLYRRGPEVCFSQTSCGQNFTLLTLVDQVRTAAAERDGYVLRQAMSVQGCGTHSADLYVDSS